MIFEPNNTRSVLQRRSSTSTVIQAGLDCVAVTGVAWFLITYHIGYITQDYVIMLLLLLGALAVVYDHYAIYRSNVVFTIKAFKLLKAWTATFGFLVAMAFLTKQSEVYSRLLMGELFVLGYIAQLLLHLATREMQKKFLAHPTQLENSLIIGSGESWVGRVVLDVGRDFDAAYRFFLEAYPAQGWTVVSSVRGKNSFVVMTRQERTATLEMVDGGMLVSNGTPYRDYVAARQAQRPMPPQQETTP